MKRLTAIKSIRAFCIECTFGDNEWIRECPCGPESVQPCPLWPYRMGRNPNISAETKEKLRQRAAQNPFLSAKKVTDEGLGSPEKKTRNRAAKPDLRRGPEVN